MTIPAWGKVALVNKFCLKSVGAFNDTSAPWFDVTTITVSQRRVYVA